MPEFTLPGRPDMVSVARTAVGILLAGHPCVADAQLIVSEAFTNSIRHSRSREPDGAVQISIDAKSGLVRIEITDDGQPHGFTVRPTASELDEYGRGLVLIDGLTGGCWGQDRGQGYGRLWVEIEYEVQPDNATEGA